MPAVSQPALPNDENTTFHQQILHWFYQHGRKDLPWQQSPTAYSVWVSEIMLQQTQVTTVIPYYQRFMRRFPDVTALANAPVDQVTEHWSGLGYYQRCRNMHQAAKVVVEQYQGAFPTTLSEVMDLPGIGRSTAGAILSLALKQSHPILDGNVKRVLTRHYAIEGWPGSTKVQNTLWEIAERNTPKQDADAYTQAMMDMGATLCTRSKPACERCPVAASCLAKANNRQADFPYRKPKKVLPEKTRQFWLFVNSQNQIWLERRPPIGLWANLWSLPESELGETMTFPLNSGEKETIRLQGFRHTFSHYHLHLVPRVIHVPSDQRISEAEKGEWFSLECIDKGLPAPIKILLESLKAQIQEK
jgi:A/G-specific adenine glycosylase